MRSSQIPCWQKGSHDFSGNRCADCGIDFFTYSRDGMQVPRADEPQPATEPNTVANVFGPAAPKFRVGDRVYTKMVANTQVLKVGYRYLVKDADGRPCWKDEDCLRPVETPASPRHQQMEGALCKVLRDMRDGKLISCSGGNDYLRPGEIEAILAMSEDGA